MKLISRREPLITLKPFKYLGRRYEKGDLLDRRKIRMTQRKVRTLIDDGAIEMARFMDKDKLAKFGYVVDEGKRYPLAIVKGAADNKPNLQRSTSVDPNDPTMRENFNPPSVTMVKPLGAGWYNVVKDGRIINEKALRKSEAEALSIEVTHG